VAYTSGWEPNSDERRASFSDFDEDESTGAEGTASGRRDSIFDGVAGLVRADPVQG